MTSISATPNSVSNLYALPKPTFTKVEDLSPEIQAQLKEGRERVKAGQAALAEAERQRLELAKGVESNGFSPRSITSLNREETLHQIEYVSELIQSGQSEDYTLSTSYEGRTTSNFRQYVYWLQQHAKTLEGAQPKTEVQA